jgi:hypothetical protein
MISCTVRTLRLREELRTANITHRFDMGTKRFIKIRACAKYR